MKVQEGANHHQLYCNLPAWINSVVPSILHRCFKYVDEKGETGVFADKKPFWHTVYPVALLYNDGPAQTVIDDEMKAYGTE